jgi:metallophosphoesterase superfamily enzyme
VFDRATEDSRSPSHQNTDSRGAELRAHRFLQLSDIHFGQKSGTVAKHDHIRNALLADAKSLAAMRGPVTRILITGDISYLGKPDEYKTAAQWLEKLTAACGCQETHVSPIPGNHDCDRDGVSKQAKMIYAQLRVHSPELIQATLVEISEDGDSANPFLPKLQAYRQFASAYGCDFESSARPAWKQDFDLPGGIKLRLHGLTSVQVSGADDTLGNMILGSRQFMITEEDNVVNIVLIHHPLAWFKDKTEASQFIQNNARVMMVGHEHSLNIHKTEDALAKREWLVIYAGATNPPEGEAYGYTYNWIEFSCEERGAQHYLVAEIYPRAWNQHSVRFDADRNRLPAQAEFVKVEIECPNLRPEFERESAGVVGPAKSQVTSLAAHNASSSSTTLPAEPLATTQGRATMNTDSAGFDRLRYLFWRYLDWQQRLKVLVDVDALPKTADQPVPQTLERVALETAASNVRKLHALWEAIMPLIPEEKRATNPFKFNDR